MKKTILSAILLALSWSSSFAQNNKEVIGYFANWQIYARNGAFHPESIDYSNYTILNYSFFQTDVKGNISGVDPWADTLMLRGSIDWGKPQPAYFENTSLIDYAHLWGVKVLPVIGGWTLSDNFSELAASPSARANFAHNCVKLIKDYQFDGIDIDWEYPTYKDHSGNPEDKQNFTLMMQEIRDSIDALGKVKDKEFLLMAAFGANPSQMDGIEYDKVKNILDYINLMTYDYNGAWSDKSNHHSPLYSAAPDSAGSLDWSFRLLTEKYNVPANKINVGTGFYSRTFKCVSDIYQEGHCGDDNETFPVYQGKPMYWRVMEEADKYEDKWDDVAKMSYMINKKDSSFVSYENERAVRLKAEYALDKKAAGLIIWDISGDYIVAKPGSLLIKDTPLSRQIREVFQLENGERIPKEYH